MRQTVLFFDLDGTIMKNPFGEVVFPKTLRMLVEHSGESPETLRGKLQAESNWRQANPPPDNQGWVWDWDDILQTVARASGVPNGAIPATICEDLAIQHAAPPNTATLDDALTVLSQLKTGNRRLVVATMGLGKYQFPVMRALGLYDLFDDFLTPDITGYLKTDSRYYARYLADGDAWLRINIGDNYAHDVEFPKRLGSRVILRLPAAELIPYTPFDRPRLLTLYAERIQYYPETATAHPDAVVVTLAELPAVVAELEALAVHH